MTRLFRGWRPVLRIARRDALRARGRSALVVAMIALPILALTAAAVLTRSAQLDPDEDLARTLGQTQARLESYSGGRLMQAPDPRQATSELGDGSTAGGGPVDPRELAPPGFRVLTSQDGSVETTTASGVAPAAWFEISVGDAAFEGRFRLRKGSPPDAKGEVAVTSELFQRLGVEVGQTVGLTEPPRELTLTGVVDQVGLPDMDAFFARPGELIGNGVVPNSPPTAYLVGSDPVTWAQVLALNERGVAVLSRDVLLDPPPDSAVPYYAEAGNGSVNSQFFFVILLVVVVVVLAGLEVTLLAGAAFAVGARRQARSLGLLAATGGNRTQVRRVVLGGGIVLGLTGAVVGVSVGLLLAAVARPVLSSYAHADFGRFDVRPLELLAIAALGVATGVLAAVLPSRSAARQDPVVALTGRRGQVRTPRKVPVIGVLLIVAGVVAAAVGSAMAVAFTTGLNPTNGRSTALVAGLIAGGAAVAQIGLIITSPAIIGLAGRWSGRLPLAGRLALRDAARHRGRSAPAMAAVLTAVTGSTALMLYIASVDAHDREAYTPSWPDGHGGMSLVTYDFNPATQVETQTVADPDRVLAAVTGELPPFTSYVIETTDESCGQETCGFVELLVAPAKQCFLWQIPREPTAAELRRAEDDPRCSGNGFGLGSGNYNGIPIGGEATLLAVTGQAPDDAVRVLESGGVVVSDPRYVDHGEATFRVVTPEEAAGAGEGTDEPPGHTVQLPAVFAPAERGGVSAVYSKAAATKLGLKARPSTLLLSFDVLPTTGQQEAATAALRDAGLDAYFSVERGYVSDYGLGLLALVLGAGVITLGAAGIATGLAQADARADHATLAAVGAAPRLRRSLAAAQALSIAGLGTALGIAAGFIPALALIGAVESLDLVVPWFRLAAVLVGIPLLAGALAWLLTRSRVPLERRLA
jgi:putative ABC transport system permease protein